MPTGFFPPVSSFWWSFRNEIVAVKPDDSRVLFASDWENDDFPVQAYVIDLRDKIIRK